MSSESFKDAEIAFLEQQNSRALASLKQLETDRSTISRQILHECAALEEVILSFTIRMYPPVDERSSFIERDRNIAAGGVKCKGVEENPDAEERIGRLG